MERNRKKLGSIQGRVQIMKVGDRNKSKIKDETDRSYLPYWVNTINDVVATNVLKQSSLQFTIPTQQTSFLGSYCFYKMPYHPRLPQIIDLLRQEDRYDEPRFRTDLQRYFAEIRAEFGNSLSSEQQEELLKRFVFSTNCKPTIFSCDNYMIGSNFSLSWPWLLFPWGHRIRTLACASRPCSWRFSAPFLQ